MSDLFNQVQSSNNITTHLQQINYKAWIGRNVYNLKENTSPLIVIIGVLALAIVTGVAFGYRSITLKHQREQESNQKNIALLQAKVADLQLQANLESEILVAVVLDPALELQSKLGTNALEESRFDFKSESFDYNLEFCLSSFSMFSYLPSNSKLLENEFLEIVKAHPATKDCAEMWKNFDEKSIGVELMHLTNNFRKIIAGIIAENKKTSFGVKQYQVLNTASKRLNEALSNRNFQSLSETVTKDPETCKQISLAIETLKKHADTLNQLTNIYKRSLSATSCKEENWTDKQWEDAIIKSSKSEIEAPSRAKYYLNYCAANLFNQGMGVFGWEPWNTIFTSENGPKLVLGALPVKSHMSNWDDLENLKKDKIGAVLSTVEMFENNTSSGVTSNPITPTEWIEVGIKQLQLPTPDFKTIPFDLINLGVEYINWNMKNERSVYVHCKAGRGRSALIVMCYLIKYEKMSAVQAFALVKENRKQAGFAVTDPKYQSLLDYEREFNKSKIKL